MNFSIEVSNENISTDKSQENDNSPSGNRPFDISFPNFQHKHSTKNLFTKSVDEGEIKEEFDGETEEVFPPLEKKKKNFTNSFNLKQKLNLIENDNLINYKPFLSKSFSQGMDQITEVKEETPFNHATNSPRIKLMTDNLEDSISFKYFISSPSNSNIKANFDLDKTDVIKEESNENMAENGKEKRRTLFHKIENFVDKYEENLINENRRPSFGENHIIEEIQEVNNEEESPPFKRSKSIETPLSDEFEKDQDKNFSLNLRVSTKIDECEEINEDDEKKCEEEIEIVM
jgi:hypothetical protein